MANDPNSLNYGQDVADKATQTGQNAINSFDPTALGSKIQSGFSGLFGSQVGQGSPSNVSDYYNAYKNTVASNPTVPSLYKQANTDYNIPALAQNANYLQGQVLQTPQQQLNLARGFNYDQNQVNNATNQQMRILSPLASSATNQLQTAQGLAQGQVQAGVQQNLQNLLPIQAQGPMLNDALARESTGFNTAAEAELNGLIQKMQSGVQLSTNEMARANQLAKSQSDYQQAVATTSIHEQNQIIPSGSTYFNPVTGYPYNPYKTPLTP